MLRKYRSTIILLFAFAVLLCLSHSAHTAIRTVEGIVKKVADGDTLTLITPEGTKLRVRLYGIDAPEIRHGKKRGQPHGEEARAALMGMILGKKVRLDIVDIDRYKRMVGIVFLGNLNINEEMVKEGWAWAYREYLKGPYASEFINVERQAREKHLGLWQQANPQPPWEFRKKMR